MSELQRPENNFNSEVKNINGNNELHISRMDHPSQIFWVKDKKQARELALILGTYIAKENLKDKKGVIAHG